MHVFKPARSGVVVCPFFRRCKFTRAPQGGPRLSWAWVLVAMLPGTHGGVFRATRDARAPEVLCGRNAA